MGIFNKKVAAPQQANPVKQSEVVVIDDKEVKEDELETYADTEDNESPEQVEQTANDDNTDVEESESNQEQSEESTQQPTLQDVVNAVLEHEQRLTKIESFLFRRL